MTRRGGQDEDPRDADAGPHTLQDTQRALLFAQSQGLALFEASPVCTLMFDTAGVVSKANAAALTLLGLQAYELVDRPLTLYIPVAHHATFLKHRNIVLHGARAHVCGLSMRHADGHLLDVEIHTAPLAEDGPDIRTLIGMIIDLTPTRLAERSVRISEAKYRDLFDDSRDALVLFDLAELRILEVNHAACGLFGVSKAALHGAGLGTLFPAGQADTGLAHLLRQVHLKGPEIVEVEIVGSDGIDVPVEMAARAAQPTIGEASFRDIRARRRAEAERAQAELDTRHAVKIDAIGALAGGIAHELNNLLSAIMSVASALETELDPVDLHVKDIRSILQATRRGRVLTGDLLRFARKEARRDEIFPLLEPLRSVGHILERAHPAGVKVVLQLDAPIGYVRGDPGEILQAIVNLAVNAFDAMPHGGTLTLSATSDTRGEGLGSACITVSDTGTGMDAETLARAFERFYTTKPSGRGTGLGLATVREIMTAHGGTISLVSDPGRGTTARLLLPAVPAAPLEPADEPTPTASLATDGERGDVLVVDDDDAVRDATSRVLEAVGFRVTAVNSGESALTRWSQQPYRFAMVDYAMPNLDGSELIRLLLDRDANARVLLCSGYPLEDISAALDAGPCVRTLGKPWSIDELEGAIADLLSKHTD